MYLQGRHVGHGREEHLRHLLDDARVALLGQFGQTRGHKLVDGLDVHDPVALSHGLHLVNLEDFVVVDVTVEVGEVGGGGHRGGSDGVAGDGTGVAVPVTPSEQPRFLDKA